MNAITPDFELPDSMALRPLRRPAISDSEFRTAMAAVASSVHVVTARRGDERVGRTATSVMSLSNQPPTILVSIDIVSRLADIIARTGCFSVALLSDQQAAIADSFAGKLDTTDRFSLGEWSHWPSGQPQLQGAVSSLDCEVIGAMETGTHVLYAGAIIEAETDTARTPLIWHQRDYGSVGPIG
jgi:flavin reductase (DIM6/NTAB) family NADH-FMN oxidoreductase RutF